MQDDSDALLPEAGWNDDVGCGVILATHYLDVETSHEALKRRDERQRRQARRLLTRKLSRAPATDKFICRHDELLIKKHLQQY